ncbi:hypothetical protein C8Q72DRAFT_421062 [Fomitopsis betulina]|nr:hypothetical protein C8Q72DRAFT_421062 [Fomitopsis betulina]
MPVPHLPDELSDHIIDYLHNDYHALAACALTCRQWLPAARYHALGDITLYASTCKAFAELLAASPALAAVIRSVELSSIIDGSRVWEAVDLTFLHLLTSVTRLSLRRARPQGSVLKVLIHTLPNVRQLTIHRCWFATLHDLALLVSSFPYLKDLSLLFRIADPTAAVTLPLSPLPAGLRSIVLGALEFDQQPLNALISWLANSSSQTLTILSSHIVWRAWPTHDLLENFASSLQQLELVVNTEMSLSALFGKGPGLSLSDCSNLRTFTLHMSLAGMCVATNLDLPWIAILLSQLCSPHLQRITFSLHTEDLLDLRTLSSENAVRQLSRTCFTDLILLDWERICATLSSQSLAALQTFVIQGAGSKQPLTQFLQNSYPDLYHRGVFVLA